MRVIRGGEIPFEPASHEPIDAPGVYKRVLLRRDELFVGRVQMVNWAKLPKGRAFSRHYHEDMEEVFIILDGRVRALVAGAEAELEAGDCLVVSPGETHQIVNLSDHDVHYVVFGIAGDKNGKTVMGSRTSP
jgi:mannose-6-phosphate isomerase-like protein (cupin superfamily)